MSPYRNSRIPDCDLYVPGHRVHWIQARKASDLVPRIGTLAEAQDEHFVIEFDDEVARYRNHAPRSVLRYAKAGSRVRVVERYRMLVIEYANRRARAYCIALGGDLWRPCSVLTGEPDTPEALAERLENRGGFDVSGAALRALIENP